MSGNLIKVVFDFITFSISHPHSIDKSLKSPKLDFHISEKLLVALIESKYTLISIKKLKDVCSIIFQQQKSSLALDLDKQEKMIEPLIPIIDIYYL